MREAQIFKVCLQREKIEKLCKRAHSEATKFTEKLVKEATKRQKVSPQLRSVTERTSGHIST